MADKTNPTTGGSGGAMPSHTATPTEPQLRFKVGYKWRKYNPTVLHGDSGVVLVEREQEAWKYATLIVEVPTLLQVVTRAERLIKELHPDCETKVTHHLGRVDDASEGEVR